MTFVRLECSLETGSSWTVGLGPFSGIPRIDLRGYVRET